MPIPGETKTELCSWGCKRTINVTYRRYPKDSGVDGFFWDMGDHTCGVVRRVKFAYDAGVTGTDLGVRKSALSRDEQRRTLRRIPV